MHFSAATATAILAFAPAALGAAVSSTRCSTTSSPVSTGSFTGAASTTACSTSSITTSTTCTCPRISSNSTPTTSYNMNESTSACPVATNLPFCAMACIHAAVIDIGCAARPDIHHCQCENFSALSSVAGPCIVGACGPELALQARSVGVEICSVCEGVSA